MNIRFKLIYILKRKKMSYKLKNKIKKKSFILKKKTYTFLIWRKLKRNFNFK